MSFFRSRDFGEDEAALRERVAAWADYSTLESLTDTALGEVTRAEGVDFATALLFDRFEKSSRHARFIRKINALRVSHSGSSKKVDAKVVIVPGALYVERPELGGDGRIVREVAEAFGYETELIPIASFGSVAANASLIRAWIEERHHNRMILVSLSKGGADLKLALAGSDAERTVGNIVAWVNVCGPLNGSRIADWMLANRWRRWFCRAQCLLQRRDFNFITELRHENDALLNFPLRVPRSFRILNLIGFPLTRHMTTRFSKFCHRTLSTWGPNDGTTCLSDVVNWLGDVYPVWGADHYFRPETEARNLIAATLCYLAEELPLHSMGRREGDKHTLPAIV